MNALYHFVGHFSNSRAFIQGRLFLVKAPCHSNYFTNELHHGHSLYTMPTHQVKGAILHYETFGSGPLLLLIPGADGRGTVFHDVAKYLAEHFMVVCWDRRGFSKSLLVGAQDFPNRLSTDADDAAALIKHLSNRPSFVFGTSSGAVVATRLLTRHPESVSTVIAHEPPSFSVLPKEHQAQTTDLIDHIYMLYRENGVAAAMEVFSGGLSEGEDGAMMRHCMDTMRGDEIRANSMYWFEFELRQYTSAPVNLNILQSESTKYIPAAGTASGDAPGVGPIAVIAQTIGKEIVRLPGGHVSYMTDPEAYAKALWEVLRERI